MQEAIKHEEEAKSAERRSAERKSGSRALNRVSEEHQPQLEETPEEIAALFNGIPRRLSATRSGWVYVRAGGTFLFVVSIFIFAFAQTVGA